MKYTGKKIYLSPKIEEVFIDRVIVLQTTSYGPPDPPYGNAVTAPGVDSATPATSTQKSGFEENPFER